MFTYLHCYCGKDQVIHNSWTGRYLFFSNFRNQSTKENCNFIGYEITHDLSCNFTSTASIHDLVGVLRPSIARVIRAKQLSVKGDTRKHQELDETELVQENKEKQRIEKKREKGMRLDRLAWNLALHLSGLGSPTSNVSSSQQNARVPRNTQTHYCI